LTSYLVSLAIFIPASGYMADRWGARRIYCAAIVVFLLGSVGCAQVQGLGALVLARMVQGLGGALMMPVGRLILIRCTPRDQLMAALSWLVMPALVGPILGPPLGALSSHGWTGAGFSTSTCRLACWGWCWRCG
jgi:MFS family permease